MLDYIIWDIQPEIFDGFRVRWYGLFFAIGFYFSYSILAKIFKEEGLKQKELDNFTFRTFLLLIAGLRLGHCLFYEPAEYLADPIRILYVWEGGLASHGGAIGLLLSFYLFSRKSTKSFMWIASRAAIVIPLTATMVRLGNLMNSEIYGVATDLPWAFVYVRDAVMHTTPKVLTDAIMQSGAVLTEYKQPVLEMFSHYAGVLKEGISFEQIQDALITKKYMLASNTNQLVSGLVDAKLITKNHPTQLYEAFVYITTFGILTRYYFKRIAQKLPISNFFILGITFVLIFASRFIIEFIKNDQVGFEQGMQLNMGQWLSIPFILFGLFFLYKHYSKTKN